jgi:hypothetical protein
VRDAAHLDLETVGGFFDHRHMLFLGGIDGVLFEELHGLAAADELARPGVHDLDDVPAHLTFVDLKLFGHDSDLLSMKNM